MSMDDRTALDDARRIVREAMPPTPQQRWPLLEQRLGAQVWVKHENHTAVGAFKLRGGLVYFDALRRREPECRSVISATRGNHGQSVGFAARRHGLHATIVVPHGNSVEKNAAMRALGVELIEQGVDFQAAREHAALLANEGGLHMVPSFHHDLVRGVASYWLEFFEAVRPDVVFVPIGLGSGLCACASARAHSGARTRIVGVVSAHATAYHVPDPQALAVICREADDVIAVTDDEVADAMCALFSDTHNVAEGAGAAALAGALQQRERWAGRCVGLPLTGGNVDSAVFARVLSTDAATAAR
jgi:threonine dehydratase